MKNVYTIILTVIITATVVSGGMLLFGKGIMDSARSFCASETDGKMKVLSFIYSAPNKDSAFVKCGIGNEVEGTNIIGTFTNSRWQSVYKGQDTPATDIILRYNLPVEITGPII